MSNPRFRALDEISSRVPVNVEMPSHKVSEFYGCNVFGFDAMKEYLSEEAYESIMLAQVDDTHQIDRKVADQVASAMKAWAMNKGVTHYTHWFQPLTGSTAEKHDGFFDPIGKGRVVEKFEGGQLIQQEPDASSFPNGGLRSTFEARGYTAWDPTSPAFILDGTMCIPCVFVSYTGHSLDYKTPLLKSISTLNKASVPVAKLFDKNVTKVVTTLGWEQEYFLVDLALYNARPDLLLTGRTMFGANSAKGQQLDDHYFGAIPARAAAYMKDFEIECFKLGIPVKTRHNEVAPGQFECAPVFEEANVAVDHNQLLMLVMGKVAKRHKLKVLLHEKPFAGVNGSGKHNNWSLGTDTGKNLLSPGKTPKNNLQFLTFFVNIIKAFHDNADLIRAAITSAGNDHRLGANEAPPAIMSVFIGSQLSAILDEVEKKVKGGKMSPDEKTNMKLNVARIPEILLDNTDRNRTSPFAFTGNKFELRAVGSEANCSQAMIVLNTIMADQLVEFKAEFDKLVAKGLKKDEAIFQILKEYIKASKNIRFEGNGYGQEWLKEAAKRGLSNFNDTPSALGAFISKRTVDLYSRHDIMGEDECHARYDISLEMYTTKIAIESRILAELALTHVVPTAYKYQSVLIENMRGLKDLVGDSYKKMCENQLKAVKTISDHITNVQVYVDKMNIEADKASAISDPLKQAKAYCDKVKVNFDVIREALDGLETIIDDRDWPLPKYREMLFMS